MLHPDAAVKLSKILHVTKYLSNVTINRGVIYRPKIRVETNHIKKRAYNSCTYKKNHTTCKNKYDLVLHELEQTCYLCCTVRWILNRLVSVSYFTTSQCLASYSVTESLTIVKTVVD